jgi:hypothetical protein
VTTIAPTARVMASDRAAPGCFGRLARSGCVTDVTRAARGPTGDEPAARLGVTQARLPQVGPPPDPEPVGGPGRRMTARWMFAQGLGAPEDRSTAATHGAL